MQEKQQIEESDPERLSRYFKYYKQLLNKTALFYLSLNKIQIKSCYSTYKKYFDKLSEVCIKYNINSEKYIKFCVNELGIREPDELIRVDNFSKYANDLKINEQYKNIYNNYIKSATYVADECIRNNITPKEFIRNLILTNRLGYEYMSGNISIYYLATIKDIDKLCERLNKDNRDELSIIFIAHEKLNQDVQDTFVKFKNQKISPLSLSEAIINKKLNNKE